MSKGIKQVDYKKDRETLKTFLEEFSYYDDGGNKIFRYREILTKIAHREKIDLVIDLADVEEHDTALAYSIRNNTKRYMHLLAQLLEEILPSFKERAVQAKDCLDVFIEHRLLTQQRNQFPGDQSASVTKFAPELLRRYEIFFKDSSIEDPEKGQDKTFSVRSLLAEHIGKLITVKGLITKNTEVKPLLSVATYTCDQCGRESSQTINSLSYMPLNTCESEDCKATKSGGRLFFQAKGSKFVKFQELKLQEHSDQVPVGHIPRSITVYCKGEVTRQCQSGDHVILTGILFPKNRDGYHNMQGGAFETFVEAHRIKNLGNSDNSDSDISNELTDEEIAILRVDDIYSKLAKSIAPEIYGMEDVKKALLLLLVGGTDKTKGDLKIRGNINICLMGDPGVAKSQLLSFICRLSPRSQFTTGRGSSGVGLTAAVVKDPLTGQMMLEGGALVLADQGICCIDEFDKMAETDRTAIHEVMEQQTISIAKAGIMTRLNARVSILAAANPAYGRYNLKRTIEQNVNLPAALLSRFDLLWLLQDRANRADDTKLANHILHVHQHCEQPETAEDVIEMKLLRKYIKLCKRSNPVIPETLRDVIVDSYVEVRKKYRPEKGQKGENKVFTSPRNLLAVLRLATALAKLRLVNEVDRKDIEEANRLIEASKSSINQPDEHFNRNRTATRLFNLIKEIGGNRSSIRVHDILERAQTRGFNPVEVHEIIQEYENTNVWSLNQTKTILTFI